MAQTLETNTFAGELQRLDAGILSLTAAILVSGAILFWCLAGLLWLVMHPQQQPIVIQVTPQVTSPAEFRAVEAQPFAEESTNVRAN